jgi:Sec-independent protein translocase protein TatA
MDNIFGIGLPEFVLILVIAGMVMGPERIVRAARTLGILTARLQSISRSFFRQLNAELDSVDGDGQIRSAVDEVNLLRREVNDLRKEIFTLTSGTVTEGKKALREIQQEANSILPPNLASGQNKSPVSLTEPQRSPSTAKADDELVYRPPLLFDEESKAAGDSGLNGSSSARQPVKMPQRVNVAEDPDE